MGSGGKFISTPVPIGSVIEAYAAIGNLSDAVDKAEKLVDHLGQNPDDPKAWESLGIYTERIKSRSITLVTILRKLKRSQEK